MITGHCIDCFGTGMAKERDMIGTIRTVMCDVCHGLGGVIMKEGSGEHRIAAAIGTMRKNQEKIK